MTLVVRSDVRPWRYPPRCEFQYGEWLRDEFERGVAPSPTTSPDLALLITMVRQSNTPLFGRPPEEVLDPVRGRASCAPSMPACRTCSSSSSRTTRNVVLTLARIRMTLATGVISSKEEAADWAPGVSHPSIGPCLPVREPSTSASGR